ncbi:MAG: hypothetical protein PUP90_21840 [Nostoc sp. S4]|nr:hypothetical protein [Nostoc sp. S4]
MKNPLNYIQKYQHRIKQILGIDRKQFLELLKQAEFKHQERQAFSESKKFESMWQEEDVNLNYQLQSKCAFVFFI